MSRQYINFKKKRELGEILTDTFAFIRENFKKLFLIILKTSVPAIVLLAVALIFMTYTYSGFIGNFGLSIQNGDSSSFNTGIMIISVIIMLFAMILFYGILFGTTLHYIKSYVDTKGEINELAIKKGVKKDLGKIIGLSILSSLITGFGFVLCVLPAIYLYVPMSLVFAILVI